MKRYMKKVNRVVTTALVLAMSATLIQPQSGQAASKKVKLSKKSLTLEIGQSKKLKVKNLKGGKVTWKISDKSVAKVNKKGKVTAVKEGTATVIAKIKWKKKAKTMKKRCRLLVLSAQKNDANSSAGNTSSGNTSTGNASTGSASSVAIEHPTIPTIENTSLDASDLSEQAVYNRMIALKESYPDGTSWDGEVSYNWKGGIYPGGAGCMAFTFVVSDAAFGDLPAREKPLEIASLRVGDIVWYKIQGAKHSVIILGKTIDGKFIVAEGNLRLYGAPAAVHWGREVDASEFSDEPIQITRYPEA